MNAAREAFLLRVRQAVAAGNRAGATPGLPTRGRIGYQGAGADPVARFCAEVTAAGGQAYAVPDRAAAATRILALAQAKSVRRVLLGRAPCLDGLDLTPQLRSLGVDVVAVDTLSEETCREPFFATDLGISGVDFLIAETGTVVLRARPGEPRSLSLLPPVHIALAERSQVLPDLFDLFEAPEQLPRTALPSCVSLLTGPSKTGDIELKLVTGVHGPGEIHVVIIG